MQLVQPAVNVESPQPLEALCPQGMIVLQGNHETREMWGKYGFAAELRWILYFLQI